MKREPFQKIARELAFVLLFALCAIAVFATKPKICGAIFGGVIFGMGATGAVLFNQIVAEVNRGAGPDEKFTNYWWGPGSASRLFREHERLFPQSHKRLWVISVFLLAIPIMWAVAVFAPACM